MIFYLEYHLGNSYWIVPSIIDLFPCLPNDLGRQCLLRVSYESHPKLRAVCRSLEATVNSPGFYRDRKKLGTTQQCICLFELRQSNNDEEYMVTVYDPLQGTWEPLPPFPHFPGVHYRGIPIDCACISLNQKLLLIGGRVPSPSPPTEMSFPTAASSTQFSFTIS